MIVVVDGAASLDVNLAFVPIQCVCLLDEHLTFQEILPPCVYEY